MITVDGFTLVGESEYFFLAEKEFNRIKKVKFVVVKDSILEALNDYKEEVKSY